MVSLVTRFVAGLVCGWMMGTILSNNRDGFSFPDRYILYVTLWVAALFTAVTEPKSLLVIGLALIAYIGLLAFTNVQPPSAFIWPIVWLVGAGVVLIIQRRGTSAANSIHTLTFLVLSLIALIYPFMGKVQKLKEQAEGAKSPDADTFVIRKNLLYAWFGITAGVVAVIVLLIANSL